MNVVPQPPVQQTGLSKELSESTSKDLLLNSVEISTNLIGKSIFQRGNHPTPETENARNNVVIVVVSLIVFAGVGLVVGICIWKSMRKKKRSSPDEENQLNDLHVYISIKNIIYGFNFIALTPKY